MAISRYDGLRTIVDEKTKRSRIETFPSVSAEQLKSDDDIIITLSDYQRLDSLANEVFGDGRLWWVICLMNDFTFPFGNDIKAGTEIRIPRDINRVYQVIGRGV
tara:strand:+ start:4021 stop:4332 length:312 start_codon:yes stop_codon:yes gene_type:complete